MPTPDAPSGSITPVAAAVTDASRSGFPSIISVSGVTKSYASGVQALEPIDLHIAKGEIFPLLGPNGAGRSKLINKICGIVTSADFQDRYRLKN